MPNDPIVRVEATRFFERLVENLQKKKYRHIADDVRILIAALQNGETPGDQIHGVKHPVFKVRIRSSDQKKGTKGGYRVYYYLKTRERIYLITLIAKSSAADIPVKEIRRMIDELERDLL